MNNPISSATKIHRPNLNKFNYSSQPTTAIAQLLSSNFQIRSLEISTDGRTGVIFIETDLGAFVLKSSNDGPKDEFLNRLAVLLHLHVPQSICYCCSDPIFQKLIFAIQKFCQKDQILYALLKTRLDFPFYQILEYIPSISLAQIGKDRFKTYLLEDSKLYSIGMCLAYDMIINNSDRFQLIWNSGGNINNILIEIGDHDSHPFKSLKDRNNLHALLKNYVYIDHSGFLLDLTNQFARKNFEKYIAKVCDLHVKLIRALSEEQLLPDQFDKLRKQVQFYTHYSLTDYDMRKICHGIIYLTNKFLQVYESTMIDQLLENLRKKQMEDPKKRLEKEMSYWNKYWNGELQKVNLGYLQQVYNKLAAIYATYPETVQKIVSEMVEQTQQQIRNPEFNPIDHNPQEIQQQLRSIQIKQSPKQQQIQKSQSPSSTPQNKSKNTADFKEPEEQRDQLPQQKPFLQQPQNNIDQSMTNQQIMHKAKERRWRQKLARFQQQNSK